MQRVIAFLFIVLTSGCATVQLASIDDDLIAKEFSPESDKSFIYLYRNEHFGGALRIPVQLDGRSVGKTGPMTYFLFKVNPGNHELVSKAENTSIFSLDTKPGRAYYVRQEIKLGFLMGRSILYEVDEVTGKNAVNACKLILSNNRQ